MPTDTLYGLAANPFSADAVARIFAVKGRAGDQPIPLVAASLAQIAEQLGDLPPEGLRLARKFWPGPLTLLMRAPMSLAAAVSAGTWRVGVRVPAHAVTRALCEQAARVLTATSANKSGEPPTEDPAGVEASIGSSIDLLLDAGLTAGGRPSTIVDVSDGRLRLVRVGAVSWDEVRACASSE
jgi:L-threonylcarbamoyladenylate synthase